MKTIVLSFILACLFSPVMPNMENHPHGPAMIAPPAPCEEFNKIYQEATNNFDGFKGKEHVEMGLFGESRYWDYDFLLWDAESAILNSDLFSAKRILTFTYCTAATLEEANACHADLQKRVESCLPAEYDLYYGEPDDSGHAYVKINDKRDELQFVTSYPQFTILVTTSGSDFVVEMEILSDEED